MATQSEIHLGKNGITENFINTLRSHFNRHDNVKVNVLKRAGHSKESVLEYSKEITDRLGRNYTAKIIGFSIFLKKWRKARQ